MIIGIETLRQQCDFECSDDQSRSILAVVANAT